MTTTPEPGRRFAPFFTAVCIYTRQRSKASVERIADLAGIQGISVKRFEEGKTFPHKNMEAYAAAYASIAGIDPRDVFALAIDWWKRHGTRPLTTAERLSDEDGFEHDPTPAEIVLAIRRAEERAGAGARPTSTQKSRAAGE